MRYLLIISLILLVPPTPLPGAARALPVPERTGPVTGVTNTLLDLIKLQDQGEINGEDFSSESLSTIIQLQTPAGFRLKNRYQKYGTSLIETLRFTRDDIFEPRLIELAQYSKVPRMKAEALIALARFNNPAHEFTLRDATAPNNPQGIRFAAIEALQIWAQPNAVAILKNMMTKDWSSLTRVFAAQAVLSLGDQSGLDVLREHLKDRSWVVRAMATRYYGEYAPSIEYKELLRLFNRENDNDFVAVELAIATLKLLSQEDQTISYTPFKKGWHDNDQVRYTVGADQSIEVEPLVIIPPRLYIPESFTVTQSINNKLLRIIETKLNSDYIDKKNIEPDLEDLNSMLTPAGFALQLRYSDLGFLVVESLAGVQEPLLKVQLDRLARDHFNPVVRATALISLAYNKNPEDYELILRSLEDSDHILRFGAMEAVEVGRFTEAIPIISNIATGDPIPAFRAYAAQILIKFGDLNGRHIILTNLQNPDWVAQAMTFWYLGRYGTDSDYSYMISNLSRQTNPFIQTEVALGIQRLSP